VPLGLPQFLRSLRPAQPPFKTSTRIAASAVEYFDTADDKAARKTVEFDPALFSNVGLDVAGVQGAATFRVSQAILTAKRKITRTFKRIAIQIWTDSGILNAMFAAIPEEVTAMRLKVGDQIDSPHEEAGSKGSRVTA
jgi:hypothetical protein